MSNYTTEIYEIKREIEKYSKKIGEDLSKPTQKFILDMIYGIHRSTSGLLSDISRNLTEKVKLANTIDRLSTNLEG